MKKYVFLFVNLFFFIGYSFGLDIESGTYYFDNSKTRWTHVQFLYGTDYPAQYTIVDLTYVNDNLWELVIPSSVYNSYRYSFCNTNLPVGTFTDRSFSDMKDYIGNTFTRTATTENEMPVGGTYITESGSNWTQGWWNIPYSGTFSGTLPVFYLNTDGGVDITSKDYYLNGSLYIDALDLPGFTSLGSESAPVPTETKGRGNYTWNSFEKKPYRIRMNKKASLLNMSRDKSYNLMAHADDPGFLRNAVGFELSRRLGMAYTTAHEPVELVLNGEYRGLYFLTEHIKVSEDRVNITEQDDYETDPAIITGGWLMEIDNYEEPWRQVSTYRVPFFTHKSPDYLSNAQENYIRTLLQKTEDAIYEYDKTSTEWEKYIDLETLVNFYIVHEVVGNTEAFHGSCYFYKDRGTDTKIYFGPVWDFGNAYRHGNLFIYEEPQFGTKWIQEMALFPRFQEQVKKKVDGCSGTGSFYDSGLY